MHISWTDGNPHDTLEDGARIAREIGNLGLEASCIGWLAIDAFYYDVSVDDGLELVARVLDRQNMGSEASRLLIIGGNFKRMGGREDEGLADIEEGTTRLLEFGRMVDAHAMAMATACVSLLAGRYDEAERVTMPAHEALKAYGEAGYFSTVTAIAGLALAGQGRYEEAELLVDEARAVGAEDDVSTQAYWRAGKARILAGRGDPERACQVVEESLEELDSRRLFDRVLLHLNGAEVHRLAGRPAEARRLLDEAMVARREKGIVIGDDWLAQLQAEL